MPTKGTIEKYYRLKLLWCTNCLRDLIPGKVWIPDDTHDNRIFCFDCAPDDAIRLKDTV